MSELLSLPRMAHRIRVEQKWLEELAARGDVPALDTGKRLLFNPAAVIDALATLAAKQTTADGEVPA